MQYFFRVCAQSSEYYLIVCVSVSIHTYSYLLPSYNSVLYRPMLNESRTFNKKTKTIMFIGTS